jgi:hypothetical protein
MTDSSQLEPQPARQKPTPAREIEGEALPPPIESDVAAAHVEVQGTRWTVRVLGRAGRASGASPPLLLLGFWEGDAAEPSLEAMVVGRTLGDLSDSALEAALATAAKRRDPDRRVAFFPDAGSPRPV